MLLLRNEPHESCSFVGKVPTYHLHPSAPTPAVWKTFSEPLLFYSWNITCQVWVAFHPYAWGLLACPKSEEWDFCTDSGEFWAINFSSVSFSYNPFLFCWNHKYIWAYYFFSFHVFIYIFPFCLSHCPVFQALFFRFISVCQFFLHLRLICEQLIQCDSNSNN